MVKRIGSSRLMIGSDYPHPDGTSPNTIAMLKTRSGLSSQDFDSLLGSTAAIAQVIFLRRDDVAVIAVLDCPLSPLTRP